MRDRAGATVRHDAGTVLWAAASPHRPSRRSLAAATGATTDRAGRICVGADLTVPGHPEISVVDPMDRPGLPAVAEVAMQSGWYVGTTDPAPDRQGRTDPAVPVPRPGIGGLPRPRPGRGLGRAGSNSPASSAG